MFRLSSLRRIVSRHAHVPNSATCIPTLSKIKLRRYSIQTDSDEVNIDDTAEDFGYYSVILPEEPFVFGVKHFKPRHVPDNIVKPPYVNNNGQELLQGVNKPESIIELGGEVEARVGEAAKLAKKVRDYAGSLVEVGITTDAIDQAVHEFILAHGAYPSPLRYSDFPRSCCTSVNNIITHGIPDARPLDDGDIINIDITVYLNGYHGDTSQTFLVGDVDEQGRELVQLTNRALQAGIEACGPGRPFKEIGKAISGLLNERYSVSTEFSGHGIGSLFHTTPWILHHLNDEPGIMKPGHCFTIEPCIVQGRNPRGWIFPDGWAASTENCARSAQAEHMVLVTNKGVDILTK